MSLQPPVTIAADTLVAARAMFAQLQSEAGARGIALRDPPPEPTTCCGRGCNGCVWEAWYAAVAFWQEQARVRLAGQ